MNDLKPVYFSQLWYNLTAWQTLNAAQLSIIVIYNPTSKQFGVGSKYFYNISCVKATLCLFDAYRQQAVTAMKQSFYSPFVHV
ncbi:hypothetical protein D3C75_1193540 [compost metagenome]